MLLPHHLIRPLLAIRLRIQAKTPWHQTRPPRQPRLGIRDAMPPLRSLHEIRVLLLEDLVVLLGLPVPGGVGGEDEVHFLEGALVGFWVEGPDDEDGEGVDGAEDVEGFFAQGFEHGWEEEDLEMSVSATSMVVWVDFFSYRPAVANGPSYHTPCVALGTNLQWENLGRVEPGHCEPCSTENSREEEYEEGGCTTHTAFVSIGCV